MYCNFFSYFKNIREFFKNCINTYRGFLQLDICFIFFYLLSPLLNTNKQFLLICSESNIQRIQLLLLRHVERELLPAGHSGPQSESRTSTSLDSTHYTWNNIQIVIYVSAHNWKFAHATCILIILPSCALNIIYTKQNCIYRNKIAQTDPHPHLLYVLPFILTHFYSSHI